jgi:hypothetical protein
VKVPLSRIAHGRSGDKGDASNIGVIVYDEKHYTVLLREVTVDRVRQWFGDYVEGDIVRYELENLGAVNFLMQGALDGGGTLSLRTDAQGKTLSLALLRMEIEVAENEL